jgi:hypothetical protein
VVHIVRDHIPPQIGWNYMSVVSHMIPEIKPRLYSVLWWMRWELTVLHSSALRQVIKGRLNNIKYIQTLKLVVPYCNSNEYDTGLNDYMVHCLESGLGSSVSIMSRLYVWQHASWGLLPERSVIFLFTSVFIHMSPRAQSTLYPVIIGSTFTWCKVRGHKKAKAHSGV